MYLSSCGVLSILFISIQFRVIQSFRRCFLAQGVLEKNKERGRKGVENGSSEATCSTSGWLTPRDFDVSYMCDGNGLSIF